MISLTSTLHHQVRDVRDTYERCEGPTWCGAGGGMAVAAVAAVVMGGGDEILDVCAQSRCGNSGRFRP